MYNFFVYSILNFLIISILTLIFLGLIYPFWGIFFLFITLISFFVFYFFHRKLISKNIKIIDDLEEKINILEDSLAKKHKVLKYLPLKQEKTSFLVKLSQELIELDDPQDIFNFLLDAVKKLFPDFTFVSLYEFNKEDHSLELVQSLKKKELAIKEKQGSEIERWMMRQNSSLLIDDIRKDFRFDSSQIDGFLQRGSLSFLASPLSVKGDFFGIIRIENKDSNFFSYEDLRSLSNICDLGAIVLERARLIRRVQELATTDSLTSLSLRNYFSEQVKVELNRAKNSGSKAGLIMFDVDDFKNVNDTHGHMVGDLVLKKLAKILKKLEKNPQTTVCRYGGEEFMVLVADTNKEELLKIAEGVRREAFNSVVSYRRNKVNFTISGGIAIYPDDENDFDKIFNLVDKTMYRAKKEGKNKICSFS
ncbi:MAG: diguanylate cyclase [Candidatus Omnitrophica bacterium]|nr:diguanylate cyclase [Candidatus Omnitrophota bacterium]MCF7893874.1 diguanylate cyclase [Candidatus Omnitrophota bacterium]